MYWQTALNHVAVVAGAGYRDRRLVRPNVLVYLNLWLRGANCISHIIHAHMFTHIHAHMYGLECFTPGLNSLIDFRLAIVETSEKLRCIGKTSAAEFSSSPERLISWNFDSEKGIVNYITEETGKMHSIFNFHFNFNYPLINECLREIRLETQWSRINFANYI